MLEELREVQCTEVETKIGNFPGSPVAKTLSSEWRGLRFDPWSWN